ALRVLLPQLADRFHLAALSTARVVRISPGKPAPQSSRTPSPTPARPDSPDAILVAAVPVGAGRR
ncbi:MAG TPA: hypothetical protein VGF84_23015, partial [Micromonosporaceae bacterium]